jgi:hypothetical protein
VTSFLQPANWWEPLERPEDHYPCVKADDFGECLFRLKVSGFLAESRGYVVFRNRRDTQSVIVVRARLVGALAAFLGVQDGLAQADELRGDLDQLVVRDPFQAWSSVSRRRGTSSTATGRLFAAAMVGQRLALGRVAGQVVGAEFSPMIMPVHRVPSGRRRAAALCRFSSCSRRFALFPC